MAGLLKIRKLTKYFGDYAANKDIDLDINRGEIHAILGENGAGKSTLVKILYGSLQPTSGSIEWDGREVSITDPKFAKKLGVGMVFQHFSLFDALSVAENIALAVAGNESLSDIKQRAEQLADKYGLPIQADSIVGELSVGEKQRVEIIRCLVQNPELIILDEPTSVLTPQEADKLFLTLEQLRNEGHAILYISHRLDEVRKLCDNATILRFGEVTGRCDPSKETAASLARMMVGNDVEALQKSQSTVDDEHSHLLELSALSMPAETPTSVSLKNIDLVVKSGEVVGIAGVSGNGQSELFAAISGERQSTRITEVILCGEHVGLKNINARRKVGASFVPEERMGHAAVGVMALSDNLLLARHSSDETTFKRFGVIVKGALISTINRVSSAMDVRKPGSNPAASSLSGGNLQKFVIGRELDRKPKVLVVNQPSWGVDAGAASNIRQAIIDLANSGSAVLVISQDLDELFEISDRISVIFDGHLSTPIPAEKTSREKVGLLMAGIGFEDDYKLEVDNDAA